MKILVFSDIHGSAPAACAIRDLAVRHRPEAVAILGDFLYHGPRNPRPEGYDPALCVELLAPLKDRIVAVAGNCDSEVDLGLLPFPSASDFFWILGGGLRIFATHGHHYGPHHLPPLAEGDVLLSGHTHVPTARTTASGIHLCNPGSLSLPKEGHPPCYGLFENAAFTVFAPGDETYLSLTCV